MNDKEEAREDNGDHFDLHSPLVYAHEPNLRIGCGAKDRLGHSVVVERLLDPATTQSVLASTADDPHLKRYCVIHNTVKWVSRHRQKITRTAGRSSRRQEVSG